VLLTDASGNVTFQTIYPGWYVGRDVHIHMKVHVGGVADDGTYDGGTTAHTGQLAFSDAFTERIAAYEPYANRVSTWTRLAEDGVFSGIDEDDPTYFLAFTSIDEQDLALGVNATITVGIDPAAESDGNGAMSGGQPGGGPGGPPNGEPPQG
jgi:protocatechuate 3,4-dioxygenase beta subunit